MENRISFARARLAATLLAVSTVITLVVMAVSGELPDSDAQSPAVVVHDPPTWTAPVDAAVVVGDTRSAVSRPVAPGFVGFSLEYSAVTRYAGSATAGINPVLVQLMRSVAPDGSPVLRIGGDSTDATWWPIAGVSRPRSVSYDLTPEWMASARALIRALHARVVAGVNLKSGLPAVAVAEAHALISGLGRGHLQALEIGNEPSNYASFAAYRIAGQRFFARTHGYDFPAFVRDFNRVRGGLNGYPLAGPTLGTDHWMTHLRRFLNNERTLAMVTFHRYPLSCFAHPGRRNYASIRNLLTPYASTGLALGVSQYAAEAHAHGLPFRIDELGSVSCGGRRGVSNSFAAALWMLDSLFELHRAGADGVNVHTFPGARYAPFSFTDPGGRWAARVAMPYMGMLMFARAAPAGSRLVPALATPLPGLKVWATRASNGTVRVVLINKSLHRRLAVAVAVAGQTRRSAELERLIAPSASSTTGGTLAGQSFAAPTTTGTLTGTRTVTKLTPAAGHYTVTLPAASAALLTVPRATG